MNFVLFLGAGFSVPYGLPVMNSFMRHAQVSTRLTDDQKEQLGQLLLRARAANSFLTSSPTNLEHLLSFAVMADRLNLPTGKNLNREITDILARIFSEGMPFENFSVPHKEFEKFISHEPRVTLQDDRWRDHRLTVITTNYDINADTALRKSGFQLELGFKPEVSNEEQFGKKNLRLFKNLYEPVPGYGPAARLLKLHGSVNWFPAKSKKRNTFLVDGRVVNYRTGLDSDRHPKDESLPRIHHGDYCSLADNRPYVVAPSFLKPRFNTPLNSVWQQAASELMEAHTLVFVGYSFPETDNEMLYLLATSLSQNPNLQDIKIIDPEAESICGRLCSNQGKIGTHFRDLLKPVKCESWEDVEDVFEVHETEKPSAPRLRRRRVR